MNKKILGTLLGLCLLLAPAWSMASTFEVAKDSNITFVAKITGSSFKGECETLTGTASLDAATQKLLNRGSKLTELLKQSQYSPMTVADQVISVFTGVRGYLDDVELKDIKKFETQIIEMIKSDKPEIIEKITKSGKLEEETEETLKNIIQTYKNSQK